MLSIKLIHIMKQYNTSKKLLFGKRNYRFLFLAIALITSGFILMMVGGE